MPAEIPNPRVVVLRGGQTLAEHELPPDGELVVGRTPQCQVTINDNTVSRMHARLYADAQGVYLEDLGSANGTFLDGERVMGVVKLADGQIVRPGQKALAQPTVLRFEDPAKRLLESMGLLGSREPAAGSDAGSAVGGAKVSPAGGVAEGTARVAGGRSVAPPATAAATVPSPTLPPPGAAPPPPPGAAGTEPDAPALHEEPPPPPRRSRLPLLVAAGLVGLLLLAGFLFWVSRVLKPAAAQWETVELSSREAEPGAELELRSSQIDPTDEIQVLFGDQPLAAVQPLPGRLRFTVPTLGERPAGSYPVSLVVREGDMEVFAATVSYTVRPRLVRVEPAELRVGELLTIHGSSLPDSPAAIQVTIGDQRAEVIEATPTRARVRIPLVTRQSVAQLPVTVRVGEWEARPEHDLLISPKQEQPLDFVVQAQHRPGAGAWELVSPIGPLFLLHAPPPGPGGAPPPAVRETQEQLRRLFAEAARDPGLRVEAAPADGRYRLRVSGSGGRSWTLVDFSEQDLLATARARRIDTSADVFAFWMARVWNHLLDTIARGAKPENVAGGPPYLAALARLVDLNVAAGGSGRPEAADLARLGGAEREALAAAFLTVPAGYGTVTGRWTARLQNIFYPGDNYVVELRLDLRQRGRGLSGRGEVAIQGQGLSFGVPGVALSGSVQPGVPPRVRLRLPFNRPVGTLELQGVLESGALAGTFRSSLAAGEGTWQAVREQAPAPGSEPEPAP